MQKNQERRPPRLNYQIRISPILVTKDGENLGQMTTQNALILAESYGLDLVEVAPHQRPPVCAIMDWAKHKYDENKKKRELRPKNQQLKEVRLGATMGEHDLNIRTEQVKKFLTEGKPVLLVVQIKGRLTDSLRDQAVEVVNKVLIANSLSGKIDQSAKAEGPRRVTARISPK
jgi:translation initiation factor IF-3